MSWIKINAQPVNLFYITDISKVNTLSSGLCGTRIYYDYLEMKRMMRNLRKNLMNFMKKT